MRLLVCLAAVGLIAGGCQCSDSPEQLFADPDIAVGALALTEVVSQHCVKLQVNSCSTTYISITNASSADSAVLTLDSNVGSSAVFRGVKEGSTGVTLTTGAGAVFTGVVQVWSPNRVVAHPGCAPPLRHLVGDAIDVTFELFHDQTLLGTRSMNVPYPVEAPGLTLIPGATSGAPGFYAAGDGGTTATITSSVDATLNIPVQVVGLSDITALAISDAPLTRGGSTLLQVDLVIPGGPLCKDKLARVVEVGPPEVCRLTSPTTGTTQKRVIGVAQFNVEGSGYGTCVITASLEGTSLTATRNSVIAAPDGGSVDGGAVDGGSADGG